MKERLSALMDDQGDRTECEHCLERIKADVELRESWTLYHLIGDVLRGADAGTLPASFAERLAGEPTVVAPQRRPAAARPTPLRYALPVAASVAAVAFVAWVGLPQLQTGPVIQAQQAVPAAATATAPAIPVAHDVGDYLLAHQRFSPSSAMSGVAPYVRTVSESGPAR